MTQLPTRGCRGDLAQRPGPRVGEDSVAPLAESESAGIHHLGQLVDRLFRLYVPSRRMLLIEETRLPAQVHVLVCQEEGLLCDGLSDECLCHLF